MKNKYILVVLFLILALFFLLNILNVNATMYKVVDEDGNVIRLTNKPYLSVSEKEAGYTLDPPIIESEEENISETQTTTYQHDFRKANWGMSKEQVKATENRKPDFEDNTSVGYKMKINGNDFLCIYSFLQDKLYNSGYALSGTHTNKNLYIDDYEELKETLTKKYGKPKMDIPGLWRNDLYKDDKSHWGMAISVGHLAYASQWETTTTTISLRLHGDNFKISLVLSYDSKELKEWAKKIKEEKAKSNF